MEELGGTTPKRWATLLSLLSALILVAGSAALRVELAFSSPFFDAADPAGVLKSDPALLHYVTERVRDAEGLWPDDFRADPRVQYPNPTDLPAELTVGQELLVAWSHRLLGVQEPLHVWATWVMALTASIVLLGAWGLAFELTRDARLAVLAALLVALLPGSYRTVGFVFLREDLAFPLFALHLWMLARAARTRGFGAGLAAGVLLGAALATWHAMPFFVLLEAVAILGFGPSLRGAGAARRAWIGFALGALPLVGLRVSLGGAGEGVDLTHVVAVVGTKLWNLGTPPVDPSSVPFDARLLWQGPFSSPGWRDVVVRLGVSLLLLVPAAALIALRRRRLPCDAALVALVPLGLLAGWLFERSLILPVLVLPVAGAVALARLRGSVIAAKALGLVALLQVVPTVVFAVEDHATWWGPAERRAEERALFTWIESNVPENDAILCDFVTGPAVLAFTGRRICLQPKYETDRARRKIEEFLTAFHLGTPAEFLALARERFRVRWVLVDVDQLWMREMSWTAGLRADEPRTRPGTAAETLLGSVPAIGPDPAVLARIPGARVAWRSPPSKPRWSSKGPISRFLVLELEP